MPPVDPTSSGPSNDDVKRRTAPGRATMAWAAQLVEKRKVAKNKNRARTGPGEVKSGHRMKVIVAALIGVGIAAGGTMLFARHCQG